MKIALVPSWYPTPADPVRGHFFACHAEALALEHEVVVIAPRSSRLPAFVREVVGRVRTERPDVVHAHVAVPAGVAALVARRLFGVPVVLTEHSGPLSRLFGRSRVRRTAVAGLFHRADALVIPSTTLLSELRELGVDREVDLIPNPVPDRGSSSPDALLFVAVGLMDDRTKGFEHLIPAWRRVVDERPQVRLRIVGDGTYRQEYARSAADIAPARLTLVGRLTPAQVIEELRRADAYVSASVYETFGYALAEAAALGTPAVATAVGIAPNLLDQQTGILVRPASSDALAKGLVEFCDRREGFDRAGLRSRTLAFLGPSRVCSETSAVYERVLANGVRL